MVADRYGYRAIIVAPAALAGNEHNSNPTEKSMKAGIITILAVATLGYAQAPKAATPIPAPHVSHPPAPQPVPLEAKHSEATAKRAAGYGTRGARWR